MSPPRVGVPLYVHPALEPTLWQDVFQPGAADLVVVNVDSGPGTVHDPAFAAAIAQVSDSGTARDLDEPAAGRLHGYVDTDYGRRPVDDVRRDARLWRERYGVTSVFLDQVVSGIRSDGRIDSGAIATLGRLTAALRSDGTACVSGNPGTVPHWWVLQLLDVACVRETDLRTHLTTPIDPVPHVSTCTTWHLVYDCPPDRAHEALARSVEMGADLVGLTPDGLPHPWGSVGYLRSARPADQQPRLT